MERYLTETNFDIAQIGNRALGVASAIFKSCGTALLIMGAFVVPFYLTTFAMCFLYGMDSALLTF